MRPGRGRPWGFTLIELMLVVAIIGLLASIAIPKFGKLIIRSKEAAVKGKLGSLRSAISIYYAENEGEFPTNAHWLGA
ncbi:MAG: prepilin-type N-terminal cleavage/methylation domain-containing protein [Elusimicrobia bacterium]|nr:prepilin-type N-terminal cleavage/methylation domain-containing protein [Elusimicrobiota bacterium]